MKYIIPRNKHVPAPSVDDILNSGALLKDKDGNQVGQGIFMYRGSDHTLPKKALVPLGKMFLFHLGMVYVPNKDFSFLDYAREPFEAVMPLMSGGLSEILEKLPMPIGPMAEEIIEDVLSPAMHPDAKPKNVVEVLFSRAKPKMNVVDYANSAEGQLATKALNIERHVLTPAKHGGAKHTNISDVLNQGILYMPGVQIVEIEHQVTPGGFLRKEEHRVLMTYERLNGDRASYILVSWEAIGPKLFEAFASVLLASRQRYEFAQMVTAVKTEEVAAEVLWASQLEACRSRHGEQWPKYINEPIVEVNKLVNEELRKKGVTAQTLSAKILERLAPLLPYYRQAPLLRDWVQILEEGAGKYQAHAGQ